MNVFNTYLPHKTIGLCIVLVITTIGTMPNVAFAQAQNKVVDGSIYPSLTEAQKEERRIHFARDKELKNEAHILVRKGEWQEAATVYTKLLQHNQTRPPLVPLTCPHFMYQQES